MQYPSNTQSDTGSKNLKKLKELEGANWNLDRAVPAEKNKTMKTTCSHSSQITK